MKKQGEKIMKYDITKVEEVARALYWNGYRENTDDSMFDWSDNVTDEEKAEVREALAELHEDQIAWIASYIEGDNLETDEEIHEFLQDHWTQTYYNADDIEDIIARAKMTVLEKNGK